MGRAHGRRRATTRRSGWWSRPRSRVSVLANSMTGAAEEAEASRLEATAIVDSLSDDELARHLEAPTRLAGTELYVGRYADGELHATRALNVARATGQGELVSSWSRPWVGSGACAASWPRPASCSTVASRRRACWATRTHWSGRSSAGQPPRSTRETWSSRWPRHRRAFDLSADGRRGLPFGRSRRGSRPSAARERGTATGGGAARRLRRRRGARADRRRPAGPIPRGATRAGSRDAPRGERPPPRPRPGPPRCRCRWPRVGEPCGGRGRPRRGRAAGAAERALAAAAAPMRSEHRSRRPSRGHSRAAHSPGPATRPCRRRARACRRRASTRAARSATATRPSASCESSASTSTGARVRARPTGPASSR